MKSILELKKNQNSVEINFIQMAKNKKKIDKPKKIGLLLNKVFDDFKKKKKSNEKKEFRLKEEFLKKEIIKIKLKEKEIKIKDDELRKKDDLQKRKEDELRKKDQQLQIKDDDLRLKEKDIIAPFDGILGYRGITGDILDSNNSIIITLDDNSVIYSDLKIPEIFAQVIKKGLPITAKFSGNKNKIYKKVTNGKKKGR